MVQAICLPQGKVCMPPTYGIVGLNQSSNAALPFRKKRTLQFGLSKVCSPHVLRLSHWHSTLTFTMLLKEAVLHGSWKDEKASRRLCQVVVLLKALRTGAKLLWVFFLKGGVAAQELIT